MGKWGDRKGDAEIEIELVGIRMKTDDGWQIRISLGRRSINAFN